MKPQKADLVRDHVYKHYILPARTLGAKTVTVPVKTVHNALGFHNSYPSVCTALTTIKFRQAYNIKSVTFTGPGQSPTTVYTFGL
jgi:hypothetical protein